MKNTVTIVIPTLNGAQRIEKLLAGLAVQEGVSGLMEVILVDNGSTSAARVTPEHPAVTMLNEKGVSCRVVDEPRKGLVYGRIRGVLEAQSELIGFLDDDTIPAKPSYVSSAIKAFSDPAMSLLVSRVYPLYETPPSRSIQRREHLLAINNRLGPDFIEWQPEFMLAPTLGAGMWVRRQVFLTVIPWQRPETLLSGRQDSQLSSGEDIEIGYFFGRAGHKRAYCPDLKLWHVIPARRLSSRYFCRLINGIVRSELTLNTRYAQRPFALRIRMLALFRLFTAMVALPYLALQKDGVREALFVMASRWASVAGPYRHKAVEPIVFQNEDVAH
jgi:glycosyltransferase involved in cell wall biosynthesis